jgi:hypothetical protein
VPVTYTVTATDNLDPNPRLSCVPASGSTFPVGTTSVSCSATDRAGNTVSGSFSVVVQPVLTVTMSAPATVTGTVTSSPPGITCRVHQGPNGCSAVFPPGTQVRLSPPDVELWVFDSGCDRVDSGGCLVTLNSSKTVTVRSLVFGTPTALAPGAGD